MSQAMVLIRYSRWDGSQTEFSLDADAALDEFSRFLMEGLDAQESLDWMRFNGFDLAGMDFRVMGVEEMLRQLRDQARELMSPHNMDHSFDSRREKLDEILEREEQAVREQSGTESSRFNEFRQRSDGLPRKLSEAIQRFADYEWADAQAEADFRELLEDLEDVGALEEFYSRNKQTMRGDHDLSYEEALDLMNQVEQISDLARNLMEGNFEELSMEQMRELFGEEGAQSIMILRDLEDSLQRGGYLREGENGLELTPRAIRRIGELALDDIYASLKDGNPGGHATQYRGGGDVAVERSKPYRFGDPAHLDAIGTVRNALLRDPSNAGVPLRIEPTDLQVYDTDQTTETTTVLLLDMSWSMSWSGRWAAAKRVAIAMDHLIRTRYPRDYFFIVGFYTRARELQIDELPELSWNMSDPFTNLQDGLRVAQRLIDRHPSENSQIIVITDGQPTAYFAGDELRVEWPNGTGGTSPHANRATFGEVQRVTRKGITINTFMLDNAPELMSFVEGMTRINKGRAFYTTPGQIGEYVMVDYLSQKRRRIR
ncbi:MAG: hypothetical protein GY725_23070 [bacterium]|nr:hypothetical protein [bacterium]